MWLHKLLITGLVSRNKIYLTCFLFNFIFLTGSAQLKQFGEITFELNEVTHQIFLNDLNNFSIKGYRTSLNQFAALLPIIESRLIEADLPEDYKFLSVYPFLQTDLQTIKLQESGIFWNLTESDALATGLTLNSRIDERKYFNTATEAAIFKLKTYEKANTAITLYHQIAEADVVSELGIEHNWSGSHIFIDSPQYEAIIRFLAFKEFIENNYTAISTQTDKVYYEFKSAESETFSSLAHLLQLDIMDLVHDNQWLSSGKVPSGYYVTMFVPMDQLHHIRKVDNSRIIDEDFEFYFPIIVDNPSLSKNRGGTFFTINNLPGIQAEMGDKFINLAYMAGVSAKRFLKYNDISPIDNIQPGEIYYLKAKKKKADIPFHIVKPEETLWSVSQQYALRLDRLLKFNRLETITQIKPGLLLWLQEKRPANVPMEYIPLFKQKPLPPVEEIQQPIKDITVNADNITEERVYIHRSESKPQKAPTVAFSTKEQKKSKAKFQVHSVRKGETLAMLSKQYQVSITNLKTLNNLSGDKIEEGDKIIIRKK